MPDRFAKTPKPPYFAVIFTSQHRGQADSEYAATASALLERVHRIPGFLGAEGISDPSGFEMLVSYFVDEAAIHAWKQEEKHVEGQRRGKDHWFSHYSVRVARVERSYSGPEGR